MIEKDLNEYDEEDLEIFNAHIEYWYNPYLVCLKAITVVEHADLGIIDIWDREEDNDNLLYNEDSEIHWKFRLAREEQDLGDFEEGDSIYDPLINLTAEEIMKKYQYGILY